MPCRCPTLCQSCAMKLATGGKCRTCKKMFVQLKRWDYTQHQANAYKPSRSVSPEPTVKHNSESAVHSI